MTHTAPVPHHPLKETLTGRQDPPTTEGELTKPKKD